MEEKLKEQIEQTDQAGIVRIIPEAAMQLPTDTIDTVSFAFWLVYMAETDLNDVITEAWSAAVEGRTEEEVRIAVGMINDAIKGERTLDPANLTYLIDKILFYQAIFGKDERTAVLWELHTIRNHLSHNRVEQMTYKEENLSGLDVKKKLLCDYFEAMLTDKDWTESPLLKPVG